MPTYLIIIIILIDIVVLCGLGIALNKAIQKATKSKVDSLKNEAEAVLENAKKEAEAVKKESILEA